MNKPEAVAHVLHSLEQVNFKKGILDAAGNDVGEQTAKDYIKAMKAIIFAETLGVIYKMKDAKDFYKDFVEATADKELQPMEAARAFLSCIIQAQQNAIRAAKSRVPEAFWGNLDELMEHLPS